MKRLPAFTLLCGISLGIGLIVPTLFEWTEKKAVRSRYPEMEFSALMAVLFSIGIAVVLWFLNRPKEIRTAGNEPSSDSRAPIQFGIRHVLVATTLVAITFAVAPIFKFPKPILGWTMVAVLVAITAWSFFQPRPVRSRIGATIVCLFLPFAWIVPYSKPFGHASGLISGILFGPGMLPAVFLRRGQISDAVWIATLFVLLELGAGIWLSRRGGKLAWAYTLFVFGLSSVTSFGFHGLYRM